jgi:hypothetical protein
LFIRFSLAIRGGKIGFAGQKLAEIRSVLGSIGLFRIDFEGKARKRKIYMCKCFLRAVGKKFERLAKKFENETPAAVSDRSH